MNGDNAVNHDASATPAANRREAALEAFRAARQDPRSDAERALDEVVDRAFEDVLRIMAEERRAERGRAVKHEARPPGLAPEVRTLGRNVPAAGA